MKRQCMFSILLIMVLCFSGCSDIASGGYTTSTKSDSSVCFPPYISVYKEDYEKEINYLREHGTLPEDFIEYGLLKEFGEYWELGLQGPTTEQIEQVSVQADGVRYIPDYLIGQEHYLYKLVISDEGKGDDKEEEAYYSVNFRVANFDEFPLEVDGLFSVVMSAWPEDLYLITEKNEIYDDMMRLKDEHAYAYYIEKNVLYSYQNSELKCVSVDIGDRIITICRIERAEKKTYSSGAVKFYTSYPHSGFLSLDTICGNNVYGKIFSSMNSDDIYNNLMAVLFTETETTSTTSSTSGS